MTKIKKHTLEDYLKSISNETDANKDADFIVLQKQIRYRMREDIIKIGNSLTSGGMKPPLAFAFLYYFLFFWSHINNFLDDEEEKNFIKFTMNQIMNGETPEAENISMN